MNQYVRRGEHLQTSNMHHKRLFGYIQVADALNLEAVKQDMFPDYAALRKQLAEQLRYAELSHSERKAEDLRNLSREKARQRQRAAQQSSFDDRCQEQ